MPWGHVFSSFCFWFYLTSTKTLVSLLWLTEFFSFCGCSETVASSPGLKILKGPAVLRMLRIYSLAGEEVATFRAEEVEGNRAKVLKMRLAEQIGVPRFRQRWLSDDKSELHDEALVSCLNVQLVVLEFLPPQKKIWDKLVSACVKNHVEEVEGLLRLPLNPELSPFRPVDFFLLRSELRQVEFFEDTLYKTPLQLVATAGHLQILTLLLEAKANVNSSEPFLDRTALHCAAERGHWQVVERLIQGGADKDSVLCLCVGIRAKMLSYTTDCDYHDLFTPDGTHRLDAKHKLWSQIWDSHGGGHTALHLAAANGHLDVVQLLLEAGCNKDKETDRGQKALHVAVENGHLAVVQLLLSCADRDKVSEDSDTALPLACQNGHVDITCLLLETGKDPNKLTTGDKSALHFAAQKGHVQLVQELMFLGANKDQEDMVGHTALHLAARVGQKEVVRVLLKAAADPTKKTRGGKTALDFATETGHLEVKQLLHG